MLTKIAVASTVVAVMVVREAATRKLKKDNKNLVRYAHAKNAETAYLTRALSYFAHIIDDNDIEIDEFDRIAIENL